MLQCDRQHGCLGTRNRGTALMCQVAGDDRRWRLTVKKWPS